MTHFSVGDSYHVDSWAAYAPITDVLVGKAVIQVITEIPQHFVFDLICGFDVIGDLEAKFLIDVCESMYGSMPFEFLKSVGTSRDLGELGITTPPPHE